MNRSHNLPWWIGRENVVHIGQSGLDNLSAVIERSLGGNYKQIVTTTLKDCTTAEQLEVLLVPTTSGYTCFLHSQHTQPNDHAPVEATAGSTTTITDAAKQYLPNVYGIETGDLWLGPLVTGNGLTCRAVETTREWSLADMESPIRVMNRWAQKHDCTPVVYQLLVEPKSDGSYPVTLRIHQLTEQPPANSRELGAALNTGIDSPLDAIAEDTIISSRQLATREWEPATVNWTGYGHEIQYPTAGQLAHRDTLWTPRVVRSRQSLSSHIETQGLMTASALTSHYEPFDVSSQLSADDRDLERLLDFFPVLQTGTKQHKWLSPPRFERTSVVREPTGTDTTTMLSSPPTSWQKPTNDRIALDIIGAWFGIDQPSDPDHWDVRVTTPHLAGGSPVVDGYIAVVDQTAELSDVPIGTAAGLVSIANQAVAASQPLWIAAVDAASGKWATCVLREPIKNTHPTSGEPYTLPKAWILDDGTVPLVDRHHEPEWRITPNGRWHINVNGVARAHGSLTELTTPAQLSLPRLRKAESGYTYVCPDDDPHHYETVDEIKETLQPIEQPYPPRWPTFADRINVLSVDTATLRPIRLQPTWHQRFESTPGNNEYFETAVRNFIAEQTISRPDDAPPADNVWPWLVRYYLGQTDHDHTRPWLTEFADLLETRVTRTDDGTLVLPDRSWPIQPQTVPANPHSQSN